MGITEIKHMPGHAKSCNQESDHDEPIVAGSLWLWATADAGFWPFLLLLPVGGMLLASGVAHLFWPGDVHITQTMALGGALGLLVLIPASFAVGLFTALGLGALALACLLASGAAAI